MQMIVARNLCKYLVNMRLFVVKEARVGVYQFIAINCIIECKGSFARDFCNVLYL